jgi:hypothetical protein
MSNEFSVGEKVKVGDAKSFVGGGYVNLTEKGMKKLFGRFVMYIPCYTGDFKGEIIDIGKDEHYLIKCLDTGRQYVIHNNYDEIKRLKRKI